MRPVLLKSAGIVGLAGAIMAVVSSNALFIDPGGPERPSLRPAIADSAEPAAIVFAALPDGTPEPTEDEIAALLPKLEAPEALPPAEDVQPETTASVIPAERDPVLAPAPLPPLVKPEIVASLPAPTPPPAPPRSATLEPLPTPSASPAPAKQEPILAAANLREAVKAVEAPAQEAARDPVVSALWPKDSVECPRDWVADEESAPGFSADCRTIASLVETAAGDASTLRKALPANVLDLVALAPTIPIPGASAEPEVEAAPPEAKPTPKPTPVRSSRRNGWPSEPPPDCRGLHAYWRFVDRKAGTKEWYCR